MVLRTIVAVCAAGVLVGAGGGGAAGAATFDGSGASYEARVPAVRTAQALTLDAWVNVGAGCREGARILDGGLAGGGISTFRLEMGKGGCGRYLVADEDDVRTSDVLPVGKWVHLVGISDPGRHVLRLLVDGKEAAVRAKLKVKGLPTCGLGTVRVGADGNHGSAFTGQVGRVAVYDHAVEVDAQGAVGDAGAVAAWDFGRENSEAGATVSATAGGVPMVLAAATDVRGAEENDGDPGTTMWYRRPAGGWEEALPVGNGRLGAMVFGGVSNERIQVNEDTVWAGGPYDPANPAGLEAIKKARSLILSGKAGEAYGVLNHGGMGKPPTEAMYQSLCELLLRQKVAGGADAKRIAAANYQRSLNIDTAVATTRFVVEGVTFTREVFSSAPGQVLVVRLVADRPGAVTVEASMGTPQRVAGVQVEEGPGGKVLSLSGTTGDFAGIKGQVKFNARLAGRGEGGTVKVEGDRISIARADAVTFFLTAGTNYVNWKDISGDPVQRASAPLAEAFAKPYAALKAEASADHQKYFRRVSLALGEAGANSKAPTDERLHAFGNGKDPSLAALYFQYGRYLLISCSRPGCQPANLQGLWNQSLTPPWGGKYTININAQMNYWPAETTNLSDVHGPLLRVIEELSESGARTARVMYGARGWVAHHNTDLWRASAPIDWPDVGMWPMGGAWLCTHLWEHYQFTGDAAFLKKAYPVMKGASRFFLDTLVEEPTNHWLVTCPSNSPEHGGLCAGPTMDMGILRDLFEQTGKAAEILGVDEAFRSELAKTRARLAPFQIGKYHQLQEWIDDRDNPKEDHRHVSHLYAVFPSARISAETPELFAAAKQSLVYRGDGGTGWSKAWKINLWARFLDGDHAYKMLGEAITGNTYPNLFDAHPPFQIDGNFGGTSGIAEMLLQSQHGYLQVLPALPHAWPGGKVTGLCARGGFDVDITWAGGAMTTMRVTSRLGRPCRLKLDGPVEVADPHGAVATTADANGTTTFATQAGGIYTITR